MFELTTQLIAFVLAGWERLGKLDINSPTWWWDDVPAWFFACCSVWLLPLFVCVDFVVLCGEIGRELGAKLDKAFNPPPNEHQRRFGEAERARQAWLVDLRIADSIDDADTRKWPSSIVQ